MFVHSWLMVSVFVHAWHTPAEPLDLWGSVGGPGLESHTAPAPGQSGAIMGIWGHHGHCVAIGAIMAPFMATMGPLGPSKGLVAFYHAASISPESHNCQNESKIVAHIGLCILP